MKKSVLCLFMVVAFTLFATSAMADFFINFENGTEGAPVNDIAGISFETFNGYTAVYGDSRTGSYNTHSDDLNYGGGSYHHNGNFWLWASSAANAQGVKVDFTENDGTFFKTGYSSYSNFYLQAFFTDGTNGSVTGAANTGSPMGYLQIFAPAGTFIDYVVLHDSGNYWLVDDMSGNASGIPNNNVPIPAAVWLFGTGILSLFGIRRKIKA